MYSHSVTRPPDVCTCMLLNWLLPPPPLPPPPPPPPILTASFCKKCVKQRNLQICSKNIMRHGYIPIIYKIKNSIVFTQQLYFSFKWYHTCTTCLQKTVYHDTKIKGLFIWGELGRLDGLAHLSEMIFITSCSYGIFYLISIKMFVMLLEKD